MSRARPARAPHSRCACCCPRPCMAPPRMSPAGSAATRARPALQGMPVVMVSANAHEYAPGGYGANHDAFLTKPVDISVLLETLRTCLKLEWRYHAEPAPVRTHDSMLRAAPAARHHLEDLWQLGMIGHVRGIHAKLRDIESEDPD